MKAYAERAEIIAHNPDTGVKTYRIDWIDSEGNEQSDIALGSNMRSALSTVLRKRKATAISKLPDWVWLAVYSVFICTYATAAFTLNRPLLVLLGCVTLLTAVKLLFDRYFRYVK